MSSKVTIELAESGLKVTDGYHSFEELYRHRIALFFALCSTMPDKVTWREEPSFGDWLCVYLKLPTGQISYHVPGEYRPMLRDLYAKTLENPWDGHDGEAVITRLLAYCGRAYEVNQPPSRRAGA